ncbi:MAG: hypothetical protein GY756_09115 [bacterium]|nr:hypothetical protein [bacterium]
MFMKFRYIMYVFATALLVSLTGCVGPREPQMTPLQIQLMQTKVFNVSKRVAFDSTVTVFQNLGYIVTSANYNTGFVTAQSPKKTNFWGSTTYNTSTAFVTGLKPDKSSIRINFVDNASSYISNGQGGGRTVQNDNPVLNGQSYANAFAKIQQQIFVSTGISPVKSQPVQTQLDTGKKPPSLK